MKYKQVTSALEALTVTDEEADFLVGSGKLAQAILEIRSAQSAAPPALLERVRVVGLLAIGPFVARERFTRENGYYLYESAIERLLPLVVEEPTPASRLAIDRLMQNSADGPIKDELGDRAKISVAQFEGVLQLGHEVIGDFVIAYLKELPGWTVDAGWRGDKWSVLVYPVSSPGEWYAGRRVLSGYSFLSSATLAEVFVF